jgi:WD40 repeat protein
LAVITRDGRLRLVSMVSADLEWEVRLRSRDGAEVAAVDLAFHPAGTELAAACEDGRVRFLDASTGGPTREDLRTIPPRRVEWSADGERLLVIGWKGRAAFHVQHLETGARMRTEVFHHGDITSGAFSPDGALVLTSSMDGTIFVRDVRDGSPVVHLRGDGAPVLHAAFSPGPGPLRVIGGFADGSARVWPVDPLPAAKARKPRELSEWELAREQRLALPLEYR